MTKFTEDSTISTKKVKVQLRACQIFILLCQVTAESEGPTDYDSYFLVGIFAIFGELSHSSLTGGTSSIHRTFWAGPVKKHTLVSGTWAEWYRNIVDDTRQSHQSETNNSIRSNVCLKHKDVFVLFWKFSVGAKEGLFRSVLSPRPQTPLVL